MRLLFKSTVRLQHSHLLLKEHLEHIRAADIYFKLDSCLRYIECFTNQAALEDLIIKTAREDKRCPIQHLSTLSDADNVFSASRLKNSAYELRFTRCNEDEIQPDPIFLNQLFQLLLADEFSISQLRLEEQEIAIVLVLRKLLPNNIFGVLDTMAANVETFGFAR